MSREEKAKPSLLLQNVEDNLFVAVIQPTPIMDAIAIEILKYRQPGRSGTPLYFPHYDFELE